MSASSGMLRLRNPGRRSRLTVILRCPGTRVQDYRHPAAEEQGLMEEEQPGSLNAEIEAEADQRQTG